MEINKQELIEQQKKYYQFKFVLFEILKQLQNREFALLNNSSLEEKHISTRGLYASSLEYLEMHLKELGILKENPQYLINLYKSRARLKPNSIQVSTYNLKKRSTDTNYIKFNEEFLDNVIGLDFIIDIDCKSVMEAYEITKDIKNLFDEYKLPYYIKNSGQKGFHLIIDYKYFPIMDIKDKEELFKKIMVNLAKIYGIKDYLDISVSNSKGLIKLAYSYDGGNISLPLTDSQFNNFKPEMVTFKNVLKNITIKNRGLLIREWGYSEDKLKENVIKFIKEFSE